MSSHSAEIAADFGDAVSDLKVNSRPEISNLTVIAKENTEHAQAISRELENHIRSTRPEWKLPALYVLDSIVKNVGSPYTVYLGRNLYRCFMDAYTLVDPATRKAMEGLLRTWKQPVPESLDTRPVFPVEITQEIENALIKHRTFAIQHQQQQARLQKQSSALLPIRPPQPVQWQNPAVPQPDDGATQSTIYGQTLTGQYGPGSHAPPPGQTLQQPQNNPASLPIALAGQAVQLKQGHQVLQNTPNLGLGQPAQAIQPHPQPSLPLLLPQTPQIVQNMKVPLTMPLNQHIQPIQHLQVSSSSSLAQQTPQPQQLQPAHPQLHPAQAPGVQGPGCPVSGPGYLNPLALHQPCGDVPAQPNGAGVAERLGGNLKRLIVSATLQVAARPSDERTKRLLTTLLGLQKILDTATVLPEQVVQIEAEVDRISKSFPPTPGPLTQTSPYAAAQVPGLVSTQLPIYNPVSCFESFNPPPVPVTQPDPRDLSQLLRQITPVPAASQPDQPAVNPAQGSESSLLASLRAAGLLPSVTKASESVTPVPAGPINDVPLDSVALKM